MTARIARGLSSLSATAENASMLRGVFQALGPTSCPREYNFHMHTTSSDGRLPPSDVVTQALQIGLKGFAITDHHSVKGYLAAAKALQLAQSVNPELLLPHLWTGVEINAGLLGTEVHILGYAFDISSDVMQPYLQGRPVRDEHYYADRVIGAIHQAGGLAVLAHPARYRVDATALIKAAVTLGIDGVEAFYAYNNPSPWAPSFDQMALVMGLAERYGLLATCGTDTHGTNLLQRL
ncbi:MAG: PHP domain-containing protein [Oscillatoriales cyanobacterium]|nr:MAG: PHP domain-containing protein [Oscillatoriales cyanobacterium]